MIECNSSVYLGRLSFLLLDLLEQNYNGFFSLQYDMGIPWYFVIPVDCEWIMIPSVQKTVLHKIAVNYSFVKL